MATIRLLPPTLVNRIAAGEVIERPAAAVKELVENSLDAGAKRIEVTIVEGGKSLIRVNDDGWGMDRNSLLLAVERHATSKLPDDDLIEIHSFGFRGEALPSIGAVARLSLTSRSREDPSGWSLEIIGGEVGTLKPASRNAGTLVEVRDLFFATPARLKFLKSTRTETEAVVDVLERLAMAHPLVAFSLHDESRQRLNFAAANPELATESEATIILNAQGQRLAAVMGGDFAANSVAVHAQRSFYRLEGLAGLPTLHRATQLHQVLFVNGRPVKERLLYGCVRAAYADLLPSNRHPMLALFVTMPSDLVDVNVHPAKTEVRFQDTAAIRSLIINGLRQALAEAGHLASTTGGAATLEVLQRNSQSTHRTIGFSRGWSPRTASSTELRQAFLSQSPAVDSASRVIETPGSDFAPNGAIPVTLGDLSPGGGAAPDYPLGVARGQLHATYIVSETKDGLIIVDQHAAHERLVYEKLKLVMDHDGIDRQSLLLPEIVELTEPEVEALISRRDELSQLGLVISQFSDKSVVIREIPSLLQRFDIPALVQDLAEEFLEFESSQSLREKLLEVAATIACHGSIRAGKTLNGDEMNRLLREMEVTPHSGQCNHGRPTWVELKLSDVEKLFGRT
ncbi:MAG: DNA mismatch repair endonuclease MutL [Alphaproteobacteria bacterium]|nr:DNA mismatch repair endonuclease MutL [Alphaproteobacteria bacterium]